MVFLKRDTFHRLFYTFYKCALYKDRVESFMEEQGLTFASLSCNIKNTRLEREVDAIFNLHLMSFIINKKDIGSIKEDIPKISMSNMYHNNEFSDIQKILGEHNTKKEMYINWSELYNVLKGAKDLFYKKA